MRYIMPPNPILNQLSSWEAHNIITATDLGFAEFIDRLYPGEATEVLIASALTSRQYGLGHTCFNPREFLADPVTFLGLQIPEDASPELQQAADGIKELVANLTLATWLDRLHQAKAVSQSGVGRPLILDGDQLYLARNWRNEQQVARAIRSRLSDINPAPFEDQTFLGTLFGTPKNKRPGPNMQKIACALSTRAKLLILTGGPGTGKTYTVVGLIMLHHPTHD
jgi:exodeoxyribonuclease V alpha subunit